jgi:K+-transporting ATPase ATPase C chain
MSISFKPALRLFLLWTLVTGLAYPLLVTGLGQLLFPVQANGSLILNPAGQPAGSALIGQRFDAPRYFWGRPSATSPHPYNGAASSGSNLGPTNPALIDAIRARVQAYVGNNQNPQNPIPVDLVTASGSGLDPHISPAGAAYQVPRVARARGINPERLRELIESHTEGRQWGILGEPRVNVLTLNLALDALR